MSKTMCELSKEERLKKSVESKYYCKKCSATAKKEKYLCKPKKNKENHDE